MLRFFRLIRKNLLNNNKLGKYLLYAIGEVILVIIGILIAVNLNNANEARKQEAKIKSTLKQLQSELEGAINDAATQISFVAKKDSLSRVVLTQDLTTEDYLRHPELTTLIRSGYSFTLDKSSYENLIGLSTDAPDRYQTLLKKLKQAYEGNWPFIEQGHERLRAKSDQYLSEDVQEHPWATDLFYSRDNPELIDYMLNDFRYKNRVSEYNNKQSGSLNRQTIQFRQRLIDSYFEICRLLDIEPNQELSFVDNITPYNSWIGTYDLQGTTFEILQGNSSLILKNEIINLEEKIYPLDKNNFHVDRGTIHIKSSGDSSKTGLYLPSGLDLTFAKKKD